MNREIDDEEVSLVLFVKFNSADDCRRNENFQTVSHFKFDKY